MQALIAEDDLVSRELMVSMLEEDFSFDIAENGSQALDLFIKSLEEKNPYSVIFLDVMMPGINGKDILRIIRSREEENGIFGSTGTKIIMTTGLKDAENINSSFKEQADAYFVKPIHLNDLKNTLRELNLIK